MKIHIIDSGIGNTGSVKNMLKKINVESICKAKPSNDIPTHIILPGVGSFDSGIKKLKLSGWHSYILDNPNIKILGICLGMQMLCDGSEEGSAEGLGLIPGYFKQFKRKNLDMKIPHMGWNFVKFSNNNHSLNKNFINLPIRFYFVHSFRYLINSSNYVVAKTRYFDDSFGSIIENNNAVGFQFHPEKSHSYGMTLLKNYFSNQK